MARSRTKGAQCYARIYSLPRALLLFSALGFSCAKLSHSCGGRQKGNGGVLGIDACWGASCVCRLVMSYFGYMRSSTAAWRIKQLHRLAAWHVAGLRISQLDHQ